MVFINIALPLNHLKAGCSNHNTEYINGGTAFDLQFNTAGQIFAKCRDKVRRIVCRICRLKPVDAIVFVITIFIRSRVDKHRTTGPKVQTVDTFQIGTCQTYFQTDIAGLITADWIVRSDNSHIHHTASNSKANCTGRVDFIAGRFTCIFFKAGTCTGKSIQVAQ